ncbi:MAG: ATP-binding protein [Mariprofundus sp.]|nr:ATP-binding protein [Mariprofundus sp.]
MMRLWKPGMALMQRLRFAEKFVLVILLFSLPMSYASYLLVTQINSQINLLKMQQQGLNEAAGMIPLLELIPQHRGMTNGLLVGDPNFSARLDALQPSLSKALLQADRTALSWPKGLDIESQWQHIRSRWLQLLGHSRSIKATESWHQHTVIIQDYINLLYDLSVVSRLYTNSDPSYRHLVELNFHVLPNLIEALGQLRGSGSGMVADGKVSMLEQQQFFLLTHAVTQYGDEVHHHWRYIYAVDALLKRQFQTQQKELQQALNAYSAWIKAQLAGGSVTLNPVHYFDRGTAVITRAYSLFHRSNESLYRLLNQQVEQLLLRSRLLWLLLLMPPLLVLYLVISLYITIREGLTSMRQVVQHLQRGEVVELQHLSGRDELVEMTRMFNTVSAQTILQHHKQRLLAEISAAGLNATSVEQLSLCILKLLLGSGAWLNIQAPAQLQLRRGSGTVWLVASSQEDSLVIPTALNGTELQWVHRGDQRFCVVPLLWLDERQGEILFVALDALWEDDQLEYLSRLAGVVATAVIRLQSQQTLEKREQELTRSNQELERFAYIASHDLQEPLRKIRSFGDRLKQRSELEGRSLDFLQRMVGAAERMQLLIEDLLTFSRIHTSAREFKPVDLNLVAQRALSSLELLISESGASVELDQLPMIDGDAMQLEQLLQNLIGNALKYRKEDHLPHIQIVIEQTMVSLEGDPILQLSCRDNGIGFEAKYGEQIFEPFKRLHGRGEYSGSGIGLSVCRRIVERHGGAISASSELGIGTIIDFSLRMHHAIEEE